ncbi:MAG: nucleotidyl transferase AbiEii/AbiGii toxin family protein [Mycobacteriales bacterium]
MSSKRPTRDTVEGRAYLDLQNAARRAGRDTAECLSLYALECFLARLASSIYANNFVLKGGVLLATFAVRRPTRDIDLHASGFMGDIDEIVSRAREIAAIDRADGFVFDLATIRGETIRDEDDYPGVRVSLTGRLAAAAIIFHLDVNFGDPIWPEPAVTKLPLLLGGELPIRGYPVHMVLAEKIVTAISRGRVNTRWRDFLDITNIARHNAVDGNDLCTALRVVSEYRKVPLIPLAIALDAMAPIAQNRWAAWRRKQRLQDRTPLEFQHLIDTCVVFADPAITGAALEQGWNGEQWS